MRLIFKQDELGHSREPRAIRSITRKQRRRNSGKGRDDESTSEHTKLKCQQSI